MAEGTTEERKALNVSLGIYRMPIQSKGILSVFQELQWGGGKQIAEFPPFIPLQQE